MHVLMNGAMGFAFGFAFLYGMWCLMARRILRCDVRTSLMYMGLSFPVLVISEVVVGHVHVKVFGQPLWQYRMQPIHDGHTSLYNFGIWPLYGWHMLLCEKALAATRLTPGASKALMFAKHALSGPLLEIVANFGMLLVMGRYYFYYFPNDLWHLTSVYVIPYYTLTSLLFSGVLLWARRLCSPYVLALVGYTLGVAFLVTGLPT